MTSFEDLVDYHCDWRHNFVWYHRATASAELGVGVALIWGSAIVAFVSEFEPAPGIMISGSLMMFLSFWHDWKARKMQKQLDASLDRLMGRSEEISELH